MTRRGQVRQARCQRVRSDQWPQCAACLQPRSYTHDCQDCEGRSETFCPPSPFVTPELFGLARRVGPPWHCVLRRTTLRLVNNPPRHSTGAGTRHIIEWPSRSRAVPPALTGSGAVTSWSCEWCSTWLVRIAWTWRWPRRSSWRWPSVSSARRRCLRSLTQSGVVPRPLRGVLQSVVGLVHEVQQGRRSTHVRVGLTKKSPVGGLQFLCRSGRRHPKDLVVRADASQLAPSLVDIGILNRARELTGSLCLGSRCTKTVVAHALGVSLTLKNQPNGLP
jgi:hypothetical protein